MKDRDRIGFILFADRVPRNSKPIVAGTRSAKLIPVALTIAGSDSGGGAGIQADLKTFAAVGAHGTCVITCLTAQHPDAVLGVQAATQKMVLQQLEAVFAGFKPAAIKTGMLYSGPIIAAVAGFLAALGQKRPPIVVDPVMVATSGARLLKPSAIRVLKEALLPLATLVTPNLDEAEILAGMTIREPEDLRVAAQTIQAAYRCAVLVKGGHLKGMTEAVDIFNDGRDELMFTSPRIKCASTHGTGCMMSAGIAAELALGAPLIDAIEAAKNRLTRAIANPLRTQRHAVLNPFG